MSTGHRAKIFAPFDALAGFDECIAAKLISYTEKRMLSEEEKTTLNERLNRLHSLTLNSRVARMNRPVATVEYFVPCTDRNSEWYEIGGLYKTVTGTVSRVDALVEQTIVVDDHTIPLDTISEITIGDPHE